MAVLLASAVNIAETNTGACLKMLPVTCILPFLESADYGNDFPNML